MVSVPEAPALLPLAVPYWRLWHRLHPSRQYAGMAGSPCGLDPDRVEAQAPRFGVDPDDAYALVQAMDAELFAHLTPDA